MLAIQGLHRHRHLVALSLEEERVFCAELGEAWKDIASCSPMSFSNPVVALMCDLMKAALQRSESPLKSNCLGFYPSCGALGKLPDLYKLHFPHL